MHRVPFGTISRGQREGEKNCKPDSRIARFVRSQSRVNGQASQPLSYLIKIQDATLRRNSIPGPQASDRRNGRSACPGPRIGRGGGRTHTRAATPVSPRRPYPAARHARTGQGPEDTQKILVSPPSRPHGCCRPRAPWLARRRRPPGPSPTRPPGIPGAATYARFTRRLNLAARHRSVRDPSCSRARLDPTKSTSRFSVAASAGGACRARAVSVAGVAGSRPRGIRLRSPGARPGPSGKAPRPPRPPILPGSAATGPVSRAQFDADGRARRAEAGAHRCLGRVWAGRAGHGLAPDVFPGVRFPSRHFLLGLTLVSVSPGAKLSYCLVSRIDAACSLVPVCFYLAEKLQYSVSWDCELAARKDQRPAAAVLHRTSYAVR